MSIHNKLFEFRQKSVAVKRKSPNTFFGSKYADINSVLDSINPILDELGLVIIQCPNVIDGMDILTTSIYIADDPKEYIESNLRLMLPSADMQKLGSAITYARRYALISMLTLETEDDDGNDAVAKKKVIKKAEKPKAKGAKMTPTQKHNEVINYAFERLAIAEMNKDEELAMEVWTWAKEKGYTQVQNQYIMYFGHPLDDEVEEKNN